MGVYPNERRITEPKWDAEREVYVWTEEREPFDGATYRREVTATKWEEYKRDDCFCCSCDYSDYGTVSDPYCRNLYSRIMETCPSGEKSQVIPLTKSATTARSSRKVASSCGRTARDAAYRSGFSHPGSPSAAGTEWFVSAARTSWWRSSSWRLSEARDRRVKSFVTMTTTSATTLSETCFGARSARTFEMPYAMEHTPSPARTSAPRVTGTRPKTHGLTNGRTAGSSGRAKSVDYSAQKRKPVLIGPAARGQRAPERSVSRSYCASRNHGWIGSRACEIHNMRGTGKGPADLLLDGEVYKVDLVKLRTVQEENRHNAAARGRA